MEPRAGREGEGRGARAWKTRGGGDTAIVGAYHNDDAGDGSGSAYIFRRDQGGADNWGQIRKLTASDAAAGDEFGLSVSISGATAIVGARGNDDAGIDSGSAYIFLVVSIPGDFDSDGDVDAGDYATFEACATGPAIPYDPEHLPEGCWLTADASHIIPADFDGDRDVDASDFGIFQRCYSGTEPADPDCAK